MARRRDQFTKTDPTFVKRRQALATRVAALVRGEMERQDLTYTRLGQRMHLSHRTLSRVLASHDILISTLTDIATALGKRVKVEFID